MSNIDMQPANAILAINSLDRYITTTANLFLSFDATWTTGQTTIDWIVGDIPIVGAVINQQFVSNGFFSAGTTITNFNPITATVTIDRPTTSTSAGPETLIWDFTDTVSPFNSFLQQIYLESPPFSNNFTLQSPTSYIYGYVNKIVVSQIQIEYNVPTVNTNLNDKFYIVDASTLPYHTFHLITIPNGFYYADELAAAIQTLIRAATPFTTMTVQFVPRDGFVFASAAPYANDFYFPDIANLQAYLFTNYTNTITNVLKTYRLLGITIQNSNPALEQRSAAYPNFLYTSFIDIFSDSLTNYQDVKDTNSSVPNPKGLMSRIYISSTGNIQSTTSTSALGTEPFIMTSDLNNPKIIKWTPDVAVTQIDIQLRDQYGNFLPGPEQGYPTEFQMTLLCSE
jgi:hypothetical protein